MNALPPSTYADAVKYTRDTRWAGQKDGERSARRALRVWGTDVNLGAALSRGAAHRTLEALRSAGLSSASVNRHLAAYLAVWGTCHQAGWVADPPPSGLYLKEPRGRERVVTEAELDSLVVHLPYPSNDLVVFLWETGARVSEALKLGPGDWCPFDLTATFKNTKNSDDRTVPLPPRAARALERSPVDRVGGPFAALSQAAFNHHWAAARRAMGLEGDAGFVPHALRHTAITRWVAAGVPLAVVAKLAGHRSIKTTMRYTHVSTKDCLTALERAGIL